MYSINDPFRPPSVSSCLLVLRAGVSHMRKFTRVCVVPLPAFARNVRHRLPLVFTPVQGGLNDEPLDTNAIVDAIVSIFHLLVEIGVCIRWHILSNCTYLRYLKISVRKRDLQI